MDAFERLAIEHECEKLVKRFHILVDHYQHDEIIDLFTDDAVFHHLIIGEITGKAAITLYYDYKDTTRVTQHVTTNIVIDVVDKDHAVGCAYWTAFLSTETELPATPVMATSLGRYDDTFVRTSTGWKFASRRQTPRFGASAATGSPTLLKGGDAGVAELQRRLGVKAG